MGKVEEITFRKEVKGGCIKCDGLVSTMSVGITTKVITDLVYIDSRLRPEWAVVLIGTDEVKDGKREIRVSDIFMPDQEVSGSTFEFNEDWTKILERIGARQAVGILHRHPGTMSTYSSVDSEYIFSSVPINILMHDGKAYEERFTVYSYANLPCDQDSFKLFKVPFTILYNVTKDWDTVVKDAVKQKSYNSFPAHGAGYNGYHGYQGATSWRNEGGQIVHHPQSNSRGESSESSDQPFQVGSKGKKEKAKNGENTVVQKGSGVIFKGASVSTVFPIRTKNELNLIYTDFNSRNGKNGVAQHGR